MPPSERITRTETRRRGRLERRFAEAPAPAEPPAQVQAQISKIGSAGITLGDLAQMVLDAHDAGLTATASVRGPGGRPLTQLHIVGFVPAEVDLADQDLTLDVSSDGVKPTVDALNRAMTRQVDREQGRGA